MSAAKVEVIRAFMASPNSGDWDAMFAWFAADVELRDLAHAPDVPEMLRGREAIRLVVAGWIEAYDDFRTEVYEYVDADPWVICDTRWHGKGKGSEMPIDQRVADAYEVKDGKIARAVMSYPDVATALAAVGPRQSGVASENVETIRRGFKHFMATGEPLWETFHEKVEVHDHDTMDQGEYRGHSGMARWLEEWGAAWSGFTMEPEEFLDVGEHVVVVFRMKATGRSSGVTVERQDAMVFTMRDGKVRRLDYYNNREQAVKDVGPAE